MQRWFGAAKETSRNRATQPSAFPLIPIVCHAGESGVEIVTTVAGSERRNDIRSIGTTTWLSLECPIDAAELPRLGAAVVSLDVSTSPHVSGWAVLRLVTNGASADLCTQKFRFSGNQARQTFAFDLSTPELGTIGAGTSARVIFFLPVAPVQVTVRSAWAYPNLENAA